MTASPIRPKLPRKVCAVLCAALLAAGGIAAAPAPASATVTTLCTGYAGCVKAGMSDAGYGKLGGKMYWRMYAGHNCTNYAAYRMVKAGLPNTRPWSGGGNATNWGTAMKSITNGTPRVGSIAWWKSGVYPAGSAGHLAYVERVVSANEIIVSMDSWGGDFSWARITRTTRGWPNGFIHFKDVLIANTVAPKVTGNAKVGSTLAASAGSWSVSGVALAYQWMADGGPISGATASTLALTNALKGKKISVRVTASKLGHPAAAVFSTSTAAVQPGVIANTARPSISGTPQVGHTLDAQPGSWTPGPVGTTYQWLADGAPVGGATGSSLDLGPAMVGKAISVQVTATRTGYAAVRAASTATEPVAPGELPETEPPSMAGDPALGATLRVGAVQVPAGATKTVHWSRDWVLMPGVVSPTYRITAADLGHRIRAVVVVKRPGYKQKLVPTPFTRVIRSAPSLRVSAVPGSRQMVLKAIVRAAGLRTYNGVLQVRTQGRLVRKVPVRNGIAKMTVTPLRPGVRTYRFWLPRTKVTESATVARRLTIR